MIIIGPTNKNSRAHYCRNHKRLSPSYNNASDSFFISWTTKSSCVSKFKLLICCLIRTFYTKHPPKSPAMDVLAFSLLLVIFSGHYVALLAKSPPPISSRITVVGAVYCDTCHNDGFSRHSYFIQGNHLRLIH